MKGAGGGNRGEDTVLAFSLYCFPYNASFSLSSSCDDTSTATLKGEGKKEEVIPRNGSRAACLLLAYTWLVGDITFCSGEMRIYLEMETEGGSI